MQSVLKASDLDLDQISYSSIKVLDSGAKQAYVNYGPDNDRLIIQTPRFILPFNMSTFDKGETPKHSFEASFREMEEYPALSEFYKKFQDLDTKFIDDGVKMSMAWFKKKKTTREIVEALYHPLVKPSRDKITGEPDGRYPPTMRFKLPYFNNRFRFEVYDFNRNIIDLNETPLRELLVKGAKVRALVQCSGMWFASGRFGCTWNVVQLRVKVPARLNQYSFLADSDDEGGASDTNNPTSGTAVTDSDSNNDDSDNDSDSDSEGDVEPVTPVKITKKPRGRRKKK